MDFTFVSLALALELMSTFFAGDSEIASIVINESATEGEEARKFLEDVRVSFPQVIFIYHSFQHYQFLASFYLDHTLLITLRSPLSKIDLKLI